MSRHTKRFDYSHKKAAEAFRTWRDAQPPVTGFAALGEAIAPLVASKKLRLVVTDELTTQAQEQIECILGEPRKRAPWEVRQRFPGGWVNAGYVAVPAQLLGAERK